MQRRRHAAENADGEILAFLEPGAHPSANWLTSTLPFFAAPRSRRSSRRSSHRRAATPGARRRRDRRVAARKRLARLPLQAGEHPLHPRLPGALVSRSPRQLSGARPGDAPGAGRVRAHRRGGRTLYLPDASVTMPPAPLFRAHLPRIARYGLSRGIGVRRRASRRSGFRPSRRSRCSWALLGWLLLAAGQADAWIAVWAAYLAVVGLAAFFGGLRFRSARVGP